MPLFEVKESSCTRCGICLEACPAQIIALRGDSSPVPVKGAEKSCIVCGHCVAICPTGALSHSCMAVEECPPVQEELLPSSAQAEHFLRSRRSIRVYRKDAVPRQTLVRLLDIASHAPSGHNSQPVRWRIVHDAAAVHKLAALVVDWMRHLVQERPEQARPMKLDRVVEAWERGVDRVCRSAPHLIIAHAPEHDTFAPVAAPIAASYLELAAPTLGLATCWGGYFTRAARTWAPLQQALGLPEGHTTYATILVGLPKYRYRLLPLRKRPDITWY